MESWTFTLYFGLESSSIFVVKSFHLWPLGTVPCWLPVPFGMPTLVCFLKTSLLSGLTRCSKFIYIISSPAVELPISPRNPGSLCWKMTFSNQDLDTLLFENPLFFSCLSCIPRANHKVNLSHRSCSKSSCDLEKFFKIKLLVLIVEDCDSVACSWALVWWY